MDAATLHFSKNILRPRRPSSSFPNPCISTTTSLPAVGKPLPSAASPFSYPPRKPLNPFSPVNSQPPRNPRSSEEAEEEDEEVIQSLRVPESWLIPSKAQEESEWLRVSLHKWLDDEYCPEETNVEISNVAATSYYRSLLEKTTDLGEILLEMVRALESVSYQDSFHGAFSSANAAIDLIARRIEQL